MYKNLSRDDLYRSFKNYEAFVNAQARAGELDRQTAYKLVKMAKENYKNQSLNRQMDIINENRNHTKPTISI